MNFINTTYIIPLLLGCIAFIFFNLKYEKIFFEWIKKYWFFKRSISSQIASYFYTLAFLLFFVSVLDLRGPEEQISAKIADQKTIVIIDSSASMLVEDVRPNRFQKALLMARHFVKKSVGHQIAIVVFSDTQKKLIPFTDDLDLLDSRIAALSNLRINEGGSNIIQAIKESVQYFKVDVAKNQKIMGNILLFTDSEDNGELESLDIPDGVNLAVVAVGTRKGGTIPMRDQNGRLYGHKKFKGQEVISRLDEGFLKKIGSQVKNYKYWVALSYSIPTEEILNFFRTQFKIKLSEGSVRVRPVWGYWLIIAAIICLCISFLLKLKRSFILPLILLTIMHPRLTQAQTETKEKIDPKLLEDISRFLAKDKNGDLDRKGRLKLAEMFLQVGEDEKAITLYDENIENFENQSLSEIFNYATALLKNNQRINEAVIMLEYVKNKISDSDNQKELKELINKNILKALEEKQKKDQQKQNQKNNKNNDENQDDKKDKSGGQGEPKDKDNEQGQSDKKNNQDQSANQDQQNGQNDKKDNEKKDQNKEKDQSKGDKDKQNDQRPQQSQSLEEKEKEIRDKRKMVKIPAVIKQILNDDRSLQKRYWKTSTKTNTRDKKDW